MKQTAYITKEETKVLYGVAILLMVFHHIYGFADRLAYPYIPMLFRNGVAQEVVLANFGKICVPIYSFISGYGMCLVCRKLHQNQLSHILKVDFKKVLNSLGGFYKKYWLVFVIFVPMGFLWFGYEFHLSEFIRSFIGELELYNLEWWYVEQYVKMLLIFPFIDWIFSAIEQFAKEKKSRYAIVIALVCVLLAPLYVLPGLYDARIAFHVMIKKNYLYITFIEGMFLARFDLLGWFADFLKKSWLRIGFAVFGLLGVFVGRVLVVPDSAYTHPDIVFAPVLIYCVAMLCKEVKAGRLIRRFFAFMGECSTYIWLTHTFFIYYYFQKWIMLPKYSLLIYVWAVLVSAVTAVGLSRLYRIIGDFVTKGKKQIYEVKSN